MSQSPEEVKQSPEEMLRVINAIIGPFSVVTSKDGLFSNHKDFLGSVTFLQKFGPSEKLLELSKRHAELLKDTVPIILEDSWREGYTNTLNYVGGQLLMLAKNAFVSEEKLKAAGMAFNPVTKRVTFISAGRGRRRDLFKSMVKEAFEMYRSTLGSANDENLRVAIAERLEPYFDASLLATNRESALDVTLGQCISESGTEPPQNSPPPQLAG